MPSSLSLLSPRSTWWRLPASLARKTSADWEWNVSGPVTWPTSSSSSSVSSFSMDRTLCHRASVRIAMTMTTSVGSEWIGFDLPGTWLPSLEPLPSMVSVEQWKNKARWPLSQEESLLVPLATGRGHLGTILWGLFPNGTPRAKIDQRNWRCVCDFWSYYNRER